MRIAIIGLGEVGRCYAEPLLETGGVVGVCEAFPSPAALALTEKAGLAMQARPGAWLAEADWVLSCVTGAQALPVLEAAAPHLRPGTGFADLTTASPEVKREAVRHAAGRGIRYVDVAIMGAISLNRVRTPLLAAGESAGEFRDLLAPVGGRVQVIEGGAAGDAISLKILRSVFTKGMEALSVELLMSAEKQGVRAQLYEQLSDIDQTPLRSFLDMLVRTHVVHAKRRLHEVSDAESELASQGVPSLVLGGVKSRFRATTDALAAAAPSEAEPDIDHALQWLLSHAPRHAATA